MVIEFCGGRCAGCSVQFCSWADALVPFLGAWFCRGGAGQGQEGEEGAAAEGETRTGRRCYGCNVAGA
jgi:hypothetical protein